MATIGLIISIHGIRSVRSNCVGVIAGTARLYRLAIHTSAADVIYVGL